MSQATNVWVPTSTDVWESVHVVSTVDNVVTVRSQNGKVFELKAGTPVLPRNPSHLEGCDDLIALQHLDEPNLVQSLQVRFSNDEIYTYTGPHILVAINPWKALPLYSDEVKSRYLGDELHSERLGPHIFAVARTAYLNMKSKRRDQCVLVSGESGSGKTESCKFSLQFLAYLSGAELQNEISIDNQVLACTPLLEAFGNAKTLRNENSSRFGKFLEMGFCASGKLCGASITTYLLERSRVVSQGQGERNYHIFYQLCSAASEPEFAGLRLDVAREFRYLSQSGCYLADGISDANSWLRTKSALEVVGIKGAEVDAVLEVVSSVLHLGNVEFQSDENGHSALLPSTKGSLKVASALLQCDDSRLASVLTTRTLSAGGDMCTVARTGDQAVHCRDALAKALYTYQFRFLVARINDCLRRTDDAVSHIFMLDIFGFECFEVNRFEQLCINYANEKLQQQFIRHVFYVEQEEYMQQGIQWTHIKFTDNVECLNLIEQAHSGIIALLDEECKVPGGSDDTFVTKVRKAHAKHPYLKAPLELEAFIICHYAGQVNYHSKGFLETNEDRLHADLLVLLTSSSSQHVLSLVPPDPPASNTLGRGRRTSTSFVSIGSSFKNQLANLMKRIEDTQPLFVRCINSTQTKKANTFDVPAVLQQLRCSGLISAVKVTREGYPVRYKLLDFIFRFDVILPSPLTVPAVSSMAGGEQAPASPFAPSPPRVGSSTLSPSRQTDPVRLRELCSTLLSHAATHCDNAAAISDLGVQIGATKVFLRKAAADALEVQRSLCLFATVAFLQAQIRMTSVRSTFCEKHTAALVLEAGCRGLLGRQYYWSILSPAKAAVLQAAMRGCVARHIFRTSRTAAVVLQSVLRQAIAKSKYHRLRCHLASVILQAACRRSVARQKWNAVFAAICLQASVRRSFAFSSWKACRATITLQAVLRRYVAVITYVRFRASLWIQAGIRRALARQVWTSQYGAIRLQAALRRMVAEARFRYVGASVVIQAAARRTVAFVPWRRVFATILLQAFVRRTAAQFSWRQHYQAIRLQATIRRAVVRHDFTRCIAALRLQAAARRALVLVYQRRLRASERLQSSLRRFLVLNRFHRHLASLCLQAGIRRMSAVNWLQHLKAALVLQAMTRRHASRSVWQTKYAVIFLQAIAQRRVAMLRWHCNMSALRLQASVRMLISRNAFICWVSAEYLEACVRRLLARKRWHHHFAALCLQAAVSRALALNNFRRLRIRLLVEAVHLRSVSRGQWLITFAAIKLQAVVRRAAALSSLRAIRRSVTVLEPRFVAVRHWSDFQPRLRSARDLYRLFVAKHAREGWLRVSIGPVKPAVFCLQSALRRMTARRRFLFARSACVVLQSHLKRMILHSSFKWTFQQALMEQHFYRELECLVAADLPRRLQCVENGIPELSMNPTHANREARTQMWFGDVLEHRIVELQPRLEDEHPARLEAESGQKMGGLFISTDLQLLRLREQFPVTLSPIFQQEGSSFTPLPTLMAPCCPKSEVPAESLHNLGNLVEQGRRLLAQAEVFRGVPLSRSRLSNRSLSQSSSMQNLSQPPQHTHGDPLHPKSAPAHWRRVLGSLEASNVSYSHGRGNLARPIDKYRERFQTDMASLQQSFSALDSFQESIRLLLLDNMTEHTSL